MMGTASSISDQNQAPIEYESVVDMWDSVSREYPGRKYDVRLADGLSKLFKACATKTGKPIRRILDCGAGTGNPSIGLAQRGYEVTCLDNQEEMEARFLQNCRAEGVKLEHKVANWLDMDKTSLADFDLAMCRGNSLIYAESWDRDQVFAEAAMLAVEASLYAMYQMLHKGGVLYVDLTNRAEFETNGTHLEVLGHRATPDADILIYWFAEHYPSRKERIVRVFRNFHDPASHSLMYVRRYDFHSLLLTHEELAGMITKVGFQNLKIYHQKKGGIPGEWLYDVFVASK